MLNGHRVLVVALAALLIAGSMPAQAQLDNPNESTETTLYFHIWDTFSKFVINTQAYNATAFETGGVNFPTTSGTPLGDAPAVGSTFSSWDFNTIYGYSTAGPVEYDFNEGGRPRLHPERGIAADVQLDPAVDPVIKLFVDARGIFGGDESPAVLPQLTFRAQVREGDDPGSNLDDGALLMQGETTATLFDTAHCTGDWLSALVPISFVNCPLYYDPAYGGGTTGAPGALGGYEQFPTETPDGTPILYPDANNVIAIEIPMKVEGNTIPKSEAYNIRLDWYQEAPVATSGPDQVSQGTLRMVLSEEYVPRMEFAILNPVYIEFIHPQVAAGTLLIHTGVNSPWGTYDIDYESIEIDVTGPSEPIQLSRVTAANTHVHGLHDKAAEITYLWKFRDEGAENGEYKIDFSVSNLAGTATATGSAGFTIQGAKAFGTDETGEVVEPATVDEGKDSPAGFLLIAGMLGAALLARRRVA